MAQQKMQLVHWTTYNSIHSNTDKVDSHFPGEVLEDDNFISSENDSQLSSIGRRKFCQRSPSLSFVALQPNGLWRTVVMQAKQPDCVKCWKSLHINMDDLDMVSVSPVNLIKIDLQKAQGALVRDRFSKLLTISQFSGSPNIHSTRGDGLTDSLSNFDEFQDLFVKGESSVSVLGGSDEPNFAIKYQEVSTAYRIADENYRKKAKRKEKRNKSLSSDISLIEQEYRDNSSSSEADCVKDTSGDISKPNYAARFPALLPEQSYKRIFSEIKSNKIIHGSANLKNMSYTNRIRTECLGSCTTHLVGTDSQMPHCDSLLQNPLPVLSKSGTENSNVSLKSVGFPNESSYSEVNDAVALNSASLGTSADESFTARVDVEFSNEGSGGTSTSEVSLYDARNEISCSGDMFSTAMESSSERSNSDWQAADADKTSRILSKRDKAFKKVPKTTFTYKNSSFGSLSSHSGKESGQSFWKKVQRDDPDDCNHKLKIVNSVCTESDNLLKEESISTNYSTCVASGISEDINQRKGKISKKSKRKKSPGSKQYNSYGMRKPLASNVCTKGDLRENETRDSTALNIGEKGRKSAIDVHCKDIFQKSKFPSKKVETASPRPPQAYHFSPSMGATKIHATTSIPSDRAVKNRSNLLMSSCNFLCPEFCGEHPESCFCMLGNDESARMDKDIHHLYSSRQDSVTRGVPQRWIPVGPKDYRIPGLDQLGASAGGSKKLATESWISNNSFGWQLVPDLCSPISKTNGGDVHTYKHPMRTLPCEDERPVLQVGNGRTCMFEENHNVFAPENGTSIIRWGVNEAYRVQLASEAIEMATGCHVAEFEKLLYLASPVLCSSNNISSSKVCFCGEGIGASLCRHKIPNIPLGSLWQWYEKHGSYGLEVRAQDFTNSKRLGLDRFAFRAYFVPYLSAVQLFRNSSNRKMIPATAATDVHEINDTSKSSFSAGHLPILSLLVPQPCPKNPSPLSPREHISDSESSPLCQPVDPYFSNDMELLFEYFEADQPQQRRPLYEMIKELTRCEGLPKTEGYGDPTILESVALHDLHPNSWYSVAWYPIYRIPDGSFRAAFLTYHSLGHLVYRSERHGSCSLDKCIVSPVVGLQSYNAQGECWFRPSQHSGFPTEDFPKLDSSAIIKERLRTLEQTASLMARAAITRGHKKFVNRQPDYEFFISRRRW